MTHRPAARAAAPWVQVWLEAGREGQVFTYANPQALELGCGDLVQLRLRGRRHSGLVVELLDTQPAALGERTPLPIEAVVRGYIIGSGWKDYQDTGAVCGIKLPAGLKQADKLPQLIFTPATKAAVGDHDENISFEQAQAHCDKELNALLQGTGKTGSKLVTEARDAAFALYQAAADYAATKGIIIADTKFEFGIDDQGKLHLIDEILTPDSSRFWPADAWKPGSNPPSYDKQYVRDYLETLDWNKKAPGPTLPKEVIEQTAAKYHEAFEKLTGQKVVE